MLIAELTNEGLYKVSIGSMRLRLQELQETDHKAQKLRQQSDAYKEIDGIPYHKSLFFVLEGIKTEITSCHYDNLLPSHRAIKKTYKLGGCKYY